MGQCISVDNNEAAVSQCKYVSPRAAFDKTTFDLTAISMPAKRTFFCHQCVVPVDSVQGTFFFTLILLVV